jgi:hypothetical protein
MICKAIAQLLMEWQVKGHQICPPPSWIGQVIMQQNRQVSGFTYLQWAATLLQVASACVPLLKQQRQAKTHQQKCLAYLTHHEICNSTKVHPQKRHPIIKCLHAQSNACIQIRGAHVEERVNGTNECKSMVCSSLSREKKCNSS